jgi:hypothetical protein
MVYRQGGTVNQEDEEKTSKEATKRIICRNFFPAVLAFNKRDQHHTTQVQGWRKV